jgi:hypothetical protein
MSAMRIGLLPVILAALIALPGCHSVPKPPTPTLTGPDTSWTHVQTAFTATPTDMEPEGIAAMAYFDWGDSSSNGGYSIAFRYEHAYAEPGSYVVRCHYRYVRPQLDWFVVENRDGDWSNPCTVDIVSGDSGTLRGRTRD